MSARTVAPPMFSGRNDHGYRTHTPQQMALLECQPEPEVARLPTETGTTSCACPVVMHAQKKLALAQVAAAASCNAAKLRRQKDFADAVRCNDLRLLERMVRRCGVNVNLYDSEGQTALTRSCYNGDLKLVKFLVGLGADVSLASRAGWSCLHIAAYFGHVRLMTFLIRTMKERENGARADYDVIMGADDDVRRREAEALERCLTPPPDL